jgi:hypothetical protein
MKKYSCSCKRGAAGLFYPDVVEDEDGEYYLVEDYLSEMDLLKIKNNQLEQQLTQRDSEIKIVKKELKMLIELEEKILEQDRKIEDLVYLLKQCRPHIPEKFDILRAEVANTVKNFEEGDLFREEGE